MSTPSPRGHGWDRSRGEPARAGGIGGSSRCWRPIVSPYPNGNDEREGQYERQYERQYEHQESGARSDSMSSSRRRSDGPPYSARSVRFAEGSSPLGSPHAQSPAGPQQPSRSLPPHISPTVRSSHADQGHGAYAGQGGRNVPSVMAVPMMPSMPSGSFGGEAPTPIYFSSASPVSPSRGVQQLPLAPQANSPRRPPMPPGLMLLKHIVGPGFEGNNNSNNGNGCGSGSSGGNGNGSGSGNTLSPAPRSAAPPLVTLSSWRPPVSSGPPSAPVGASTSSSAPISGGRSSTTGHQRQQSSPQARAEASTPAAPARVSVSASLSSSRKARSAEPSSPAAPNSSCPSLHFNHSSTSVSQVRSTTTSARLQAGLGGHGMGHASQVWATQKETPGLRRVPPQLGVQPPFPRVPTHDPQRQAASTHTQGSTRTSPTKTQSKTLSKTRAPSTASASDSASPVRGVTSPRAAALPSSSSAPPPPLAANSPATGSPASTRGYTPVTPVLDDTEFSKNAPTVERKQSQSATSLERRAMALATSMVERERAEATEYITELRQKLADVDRQARALLDGSDARDAKIQRLQADMDARDAKIAEQSECIKKMGESPYVAEQLSRAVDKCARLERDVEEQKRSLEMADKAYREQLRSLRRQHEGTVDNLRAQQQKEVAELVERRGGSATDKLRSALKAESSTVKRQVKEIAGLQADLAVALAQAGGAGKDEQAGNAANSTINMLRNQIQGLQRGLAATASLQKSLSDANATIATHAQTIARIEPSLTAANAAAAEHKREVSELERALQTERNSVTTLKEENNAQIRPNQPLAAKCRHLSAASDVTADKERKAEKAAQAELKSRQYEIDGLREDLEVATAARIKATEKQNLALAAKDATIRTQARRIGEVQGELSKLQTQLFDRAQVGHYDSLLVDATAAVAKAKEEAERAKEEAERAKEEAAQANVAQQQAKDAQHQAKRALKEQAGELLWYKQKFLDYQDRLLMHNGHRMNEATRNQMWRDLAKDNGLTYSVEKQGRRLFYMDKNRRQYLRTVGEDGEAVYDVKPDIDALEASTSRPVEKYDYESEESQVPFHELDNDPDHFFTPNTQPDGEEALDVMKAMDVMDTMDADELEHDYLVEDDSDRERDSSGTPAAESAAPATVPYTPLAFPRLMFSQSSALPSAAALSGTMSPHAIKSQKLRALAAKQAAARAELARASEPSPKPLLDPPSPRPTKKRATKGGEKKKQPSSSSQAKKAPPKRPAKVPAAKAKAAPPQKATAKKVKAAKAAAAAASGSGPTAASLQAPAPPASATQFTGPGKEAGDAVAVATPGPALEPELPQLQAPADTFTPGLAPDSVPSPAAGTVPGLPKKRGRAMRYDEDDRIDPLTNKRRKNWVGYGLEPEVNAEPTHLDTAPELSGTVETEEGGNMVRRSVRRLGLAGTGNSLSAPSPTSTTHSVFSPSPLAVVSAPSPLKY